MAVLIGLDIGTTHFKALAVDEGGRILASSSTATPATGEGGGHVVYEAGAVWAAVCRLLQDVVRQVDRRDIVGVASASMAEAGFLLDGDGRPLMPAIAWFDPRTREVAREWERLAGWERVRRTTGLSVDLTYSLAKILWIRENRPDVYARARRWLGMAEWVAFKLSGIPATDYTLATRTMAYDVVAEAWSEDLLQLADVDPSLFPPVLPAGTPLGNVLPEAAAETGLPAHATVTVGGHDHLCATLSTGAISPGIVLNSCGTAEAVLAALDRETFMRVLPDRQITLGHHLFPGLYYAVTSLRTSGLSSKWFLENLLTGPEPDHAEFIRRAKASPPGANGLFFFPYLRDVSEVRDAVGSTGAFLGLRDYHTNSDVARAVIEGLGFEFCRMLERLQPALPGPSPEVRVVGGSTRNDLWMQVKADVLGRPIHVWEVAEATAHGAALLAGLGSGVFATPGDILALDPHRQVVFEPDPGRHQVYQSRYKLYCDLVPLVIEMGKRLRP